jgi:hypothetical protein
MWRWDGLRFQFRGTQPIHAEQHRDEELNLRVHRGPLSLSISHLSGPAHDSSAEGSPFLDDEGR